MDRSKAIDILRALAITLVCFCRHIPPCPAGPDWVHRFFHAVTVILERGGWIGVDIFFVLSGFLVSGLLFREHQKYGNILGFRFLIRRGFKIYPSFWLLIALTALVGFFHHRNPLIQTIAELTFTQNYFPGLWWHTWSLAVEEHFYLLLVLFLIFLTRSREDNPFRSIPKAFVVLATLTLLARVATAYTHEYSNQISLFPSHLRIDSLFFGVLISYYYHYNTSTFARFAHRWKWYLIAFGIIALIPPFLFSIEKAPFVYTIGLTLLYAGSGCLLMVCSVISLPASRAANLVAYVGSHSYSIYLWAGAISSWLMPFLAKMLAPHWSWPVGVSCYVLSTLALGISMALFVEFPMLKIRDRWFPSRSSQFGVPLEHRKTSR
jgi:peptidoglycan/LPS O-acetylase OafA/YrhL